MGSGETPRATCILANTDQGEVLIRQGSTALPPQGDPPPGQANLIRILYAKSCVGAWIIAAADRRGRAACHPPFSQADSLRHRYVRIGTVPVLSHSPSRRSNISGVSSRSSHVTGGSSRSPPGVVSSLLSGLQGTRLVQGYPLSYRQLCAAVTSSYVRPAVASPIHVPSCLSFSGPSMSADTFLPGNDASSTL